MKPDFFDNVTWKQRSILTTLEKLIKNKGYVTIKRHKICCYNKEKNSKEQLDNYNLLHPAKHREDLKVDKQSAVFLRARLDIFRWSNLYSSELM